MAEETITYTKKISGMLASFSVIVLLGVNLFNTMTIDVNTLIFVVVKVLPVALIMGYLGSLIGRILDNPKGYENRK